MPIVFMLVLISLMAGSPLSLAQGVPVSLAESSSKAVSAGNTICPVMGGAVSDQSPFKVEYKGMIYNLCCGGCKEIFLKDPEAAIKKLGVSQGPSAIE
ncbi:MAG: YHS domain-containing protein [Candidatus Omnitrophota bacterium]